MTPGNFIKRNDFLDFSSLELYFFEKWAPSQFWPISPQNEFLTLKKAYSSKPFYGLKDSRFRFLPGMKLRLSPKKDAAYLIYFQTLSPRLYVPLAKVRILKPKKVTKYLLRAVYLRSTASPAESPRDLRYRHRL